MSSRIVKIKHEIIAACKSANYRGIEIVQKEDLLVSFHEDYTFSMQMSPLTAVYFKNKTTDSIYREIYSDTSAEFSESQYKLEELGGKILGMSIQESKSFIESFNNLEKSFSKRDLFYTLGEYVRKQILKTQATCKVKAFNIPIEYKVK